jgi:hypothetical protein
MTLREDEDRMKAQRMHPGYGGMPRLIVAAALALLCAVLLGGAARAAAGETHVFDATLSLTGDCATSAADEVPDPGTCPIPPGTVFEGAPGANHPSKAFDGVMSIAVDGYGDRYVSSRGTSDGSDGRIDVFGPDGTFITEIADPDAPIAIQVDSQGNLYVRDGSDSISETTMLRLYAPTTYNPASGQIGYGASPTVTPVSSAYYSFAVNPANDHLFTTPKDCCISEYGSAAEGNVKLEESDGSGSLHSPGGIAVDAAHNRLYVGSTKGIVGEPEYAQTVVRVFELKAPHALLGTLDGSSTLAGKFLTATHALPLAVEEETGHLFFGELGNVAKRKVYELEFQPGSGETLVSTIERSFAFNSGFPQIALDNGPSSPVRGTLFVPSRLSAPVHLYAFKRKPPVDLPLVESTSLSGITANEAVLRAALNPKGLETTYRFEYTTEARFAEEGNTFSGATLAREGTLPAGYAGVAVSAPLSGLAPATAYRFRLVAENEEGEVEAQRALATYRAPDVFGGCPNEALRIGASAALPDCRAWELVTPASTNGHQPYGSARYDAGSILFPTRGASPDGDAVSFLVEGGGIPGLGGSGSFKGDAYVSTRGIHGWQTVAAEPSGAETPEFSPGSVAAEQGYSFFIAQGSGGPEAFLRYPDGHFELIGRGSLGADPLAQGRLISPDGSHVLFTSTVMLEEGAPETGTEAIYDRTIDPESGAEQTHVVSLLPGDVTPAAGEKASYEGASDDGRGVAFRVFSGNSPSGPIYLRRDSKTYEAAPAESTFVGLSVDGSSLIYLHAGDLWRFDAEGEGTTRFTEAGDVTVVNVSADGTTAYFVSPSVLAAANPRGAMPLSGGENLYRSKEGAISFLGTVTKLDVEGELNNPQTEALGLWTASLHGGTPPIDPSRSTPDGSVLLFSSRADLTGQESEARPQLYRYDAAQESITCITCIPTGIATASGATLLSMSAGWREDALPLTRRADLRNLTPDGHRAFFESSEPLVPADTDGLQDVYEWEEKGAGSCQIEGGCVYLISSGQSAEPNYLYAVSDSGDDVFIETSDLLIPAEDPDETPSIYDAHVKGGFPPPASPAGECLGEACQPAASAPEEVTPATFETAGNVTPESTARCRAGRHEVRRHGTVRCVKTTKGKKHQRRAHRKGRKHR